MSLLILFPCFKSLCRNLRWDVVSAYKENTTNETSVNIAEVCILLTGFAREKKKSYFWIWENKIILQFKVLTSIHTARVTCTPGENAPILCYYSNTFFFCLLRVHMLVHINWGLTCTSAVREKKWEAVNRCYARDRLWREQEKGEQKWGMGNQEKVVEVGTIVIQC